jgi:tetratricopeptide (TPR) repeat protein
MLDPSDLPPAERHQLLFEQANACHKADQPHQALKIFAAIIAENPNYPNVFVHAGNVAKDLGHDEHALALYQHAESLASRNVFEWPAIQFNISNALRNVCEFELSRRHALNAAEAAPYDDAFVVGAYLSCLLTGDFENGWKWYGKRPMRRKQVPTDAPRWDGSPLDPETPLLLWIEQGVGEEIMFASMLDEVKALAPDLTVLCEPRLVPLYRRSMPHIKFGHTVHYAKSARQLPLGDLCGILRPTWSRFPAPRAYLKADPLRAAELRAKYAGGRETLTVGVHWQSVGSPVAEQKSLTLADLEPIFSVDKCNFVSLQHSLADCDEAARFMLVDATIDPKKDLDGAAAQIDAVDVVVTNSSAAAHLAGALGKETWVVLPAAKGLLWHWFIDREDSVWYPRVKLMRQARDEKTWAGVVSRIARQLDDRVRRA